MADPVPIVEPAAYTIRRTVSCHFEMLQAWARTISAPPFGSVQSSLKELESYCGACPGATRSGPLVDETEELIRFH